MNDKEKYTKDISTKKLYLKRVYNFIKKSYKEYKDSEYYGKFNTCQHKFGEEYIEGMDLLNTTIWICKYWAKNLTQESWRSYRAPLKFFSEIYLEMELITNNEYDRICAVLDSTKGSPRKEIEERTSRKKQKHLSIADLKIIDEELKKSKSAWAKPTRAWLRAGILTGLRPVEWRNSSLVKIDDEIYLKVLNAKNTNNRANGDYRHLNLEHLTENEILIVKTHLKVCNTFSSSKKEWDSFYNGCSNLLRLKTRKAFPKRKKFPTLYSTRHQFSANSKASGCRPEEVAALMGHASDLTAQMTYGKKRQGQTKRKPKILSNEVDSVRISKKTEKYFSFDRKIKQKNQTKNK